MVRIDDIDDFRDFIGYVVLSAPNNFPVEDFLPPDQQMNLENSFELLNQSLDMVCKDLEISNKKGSLQEILQESLLAYRAGDERTGALRLQDFLEEIFGDTLWT